MLNELKEVNRRVNADTRYRTDIAAYHKKEFWAVADGFGDCEDYALRKRQELITLGWPLEVLKLATCRTETGEDHAVLTVDLDGKTYVLDNRFPNVREWHTVPYVWFKRQSGHGWVRILQPQ